MFLKAGSLVINPPLILAPMAGITCGSFRRLIHELNPGMCGLYYTEFASIEGLVRQNQATLRLIKKSDIDCTAPFAVQLFGMDPENMALSGKIAVDYGADIVDINAGCPAQKVVKKGGGADLLKRPALIGEIVKRVKERVSVPVTVKIRIGWDEKSINLFEVARIIEDNGADMITIHGRTRSQGFTGLSDWEMIRKAKEILKIPVVGNGDIVDIKSFEERKKCSGVDAVMIGRGILKDPWIFKRLTFKPGEFKEPTNEDKYCIFERFAEYLANDGFPSGAVLGQLKQLAVRFLRAKPNSVQFRTEALRSNETPHFLAAVKKYLFWDI